MSTPKKLNIGLVGYGFMGRTHSNAFGQAPRSSTRISASVAGHLCARSRESGGLASRWGYESFETDWRALVDRNDIDLIDIASPNDTHAEIAIAAAKAGKMVLCEKPLGRNAVEAEEMVRAVEAAGVPNMVWYNYRRVPAVTLARHLVESGKAWAHLSLPRKIPAGLDDLAGSPPGWRGSLAARCECRRQRSHRRSAGALHRHRYVAQWRHRPCLGDDRNVHQTAHA